MLNLMHVCGANHVGSVLMTYVNEYNMNLGEIIEQIKKRWTSSQRFELIIELDEAPRGAATGKEAMGLEGQFLLRLKKTNLDASNEIGDLVDEYVKTSAEHGLRLIE